MNQAQTLLVIGLGLIGGSIAMAAQRQGGYARIWGHDPQTKTVQQALDRQIIDAGPTRFEEQVRQATLIVVAVPPLTVRSVLAQLRPALQPQAVLTDTTSIKGAVLQAATEVFGQFPPWMVLGHPLAGSERSGLEAAREDLFDGCRVIISPQPDTNPQALSVVRLLWQSLGAKVVELAPDEHDQLLAFSSHLPHLLAFAAVNTLLTQKRNDLFNYAGGGLVDFSRIAASNPLMWKDIALGNREALLAAMDAFAGQFDRLRKAIEEQNAEFINQAFATARTARQNLIRDFRKKI